MKQRPRPWLACAVAGALASPAFAAPSEPAPLAPSDFAYGREIVLPEARHPLVRVDVPVDVYRAMRGAGLAELMVFNGRGAQVPHAIRSVPPGSSAPADAVSLPLFPLPGGAAPSARAGDLRLEVERDAQGRVVRLAAVSGAVPGAAAGSSAPQPIAAYVLDARALPRRLVGLRVQLSDTADERVFSLRLEASDDLVSFSDVPVTGAIVQLGHGGDRIDRDVIAIPPTQASFYRLTPRRESNFPATVALVHATLESVEPPRPFERLAVPAGKSAKTRVHRFDLGGPVPVDRVEIELPEANTIVNAELRSAPKREGPYSTVARLRLYRVETEAGELRPAPVDIARGNDRYYELRVEPKGGGLGAGTPVLVTYRAPDELVLMRRGDGPFTLAYGRYAAPPSRFEADDLLHLLPREQEAAPKGQLRDPKTLGGPDRLQPPKPPPPYKTYAIWAVLIAGVTLLGAFALHLARSGEPRV